MTARDQLIQKLDSALKSRSDKECVTVEQQTFDSCSYDVVGGSVRYIDGTLDLGEIANISLSRIAELEAALEEALSVGYFGDNQEAHERLYKILENK
jgi:hypothetical protein